VNTVVQLALLGWGTLCGIDLVSVPQMMIARPLVAGALAGAILGDVETGLRLGVLFELYQFDILPVGAARYPEYGPATVAAVAAAHGTRGGFGLGVIAGLVIALLGGSSLQLLRRLNARAANRAGALIEAGDAAALVRVHVAAIGRDGVRALLVTAAGLALATVARTLLLPALSARALTLVGVAGAAGALAAATAGTLRLVGWGRPLTWLALGLGGGAALVWLQ
jgi:mannose/fructose/N-acetylgalactosamine-specific phosphotransferase system component IIC